MHEECQNSVIHTHCFSPPWSSVPCSSRECKPTCRQRIHRHRTSCVERAGRCRHRLQAESRSRPRPLPANQQVFPASRSRAARAEPATFGQRRRMAARWAALAASASRLPVQGRRTTSQDALPWRPSIGSKVVAARSLDRLARVGPCDARLRHLPRVQRQAHRLQSLRGRRTTPRDEGVVLRGMGNPSFQPI